ncbi:MAG: hypothetical protein H0W33_04985 [Gammaproteobacteria bacterium]|nr:hypothetical protein [Gammaproteobacteria bacterium]
MNRGRAVDLSAATVAALDAFPLNVRSARLNQATQRHVESNAVRLLSLARSLRAGGLPRECIALILVAVAEELLGP